MSNSLIAIIPSKVRNAGDTILSLAEILAGDLPHASRVQRTYEQGYWYAIGRMDGETEGRGDHAEADLFGRARATAFYRMWTGQTVSTGSMMEDYENSKHDMRETINH